DLVRYQSHATDQDKPKDDPVSLQFFKHLTGCVVTICSRHDQSCWKHYQTGDFSPDDEQLDPATGEPVPGGVTINTVSLLPIQPKTILYQNQTANPSK